MAIHLNLARRIKVHVWDANEFEESKHPRAKSGEFAKKGTEGFLPASGGGKLPAHIEKLKIPPAWTDVRFSPDPKSSLQAVGRDGKGREQRIYSEKFSASQSAAKFARIKKLEAIFEKASSKNQKLLSAKDATTREAATVLALIMSTGIRPGSEQETGAARKAYGATTLLGQHVHVDKDKVSLKFPGKSGKDLDIPVKDLAIAALVKKAASSAKPDGQLFPMVTSGGLLRHVKNVTGDGFKTKDFRTLIGTKLAMEHVASATEPTSPTAYKKAVRAVAETVSKALGNTPTVALQSYISPFVFAKWRLSAGV